MRDYSEGDYGFGVYGSKLTPIVTQHLIDYFPDALKRQEENGTPSVFTKYINTHEEQLRKFDAKLGYVQQSREIDFAADADLDKLGSKFGELGKRRGRSDDEYRTYLKGLVQSFNGRGTKPGLKFAIAASINTETENITIDEDFENNEYSIRIDDPQAGFLSSVVNDVAELADPSGVELADAPVVGLEGADIRIHAEESKVIESTSGLGSEGTDLGEDWTLK